VWRGFKKPASPCLFYKSEFTMMKHLSSDDIRKLHMQLVQMRTRLLDEIQTAEADIKAVHEAREGEGRGDSDASEITRFEELRRSEIGIDERHLRAVEEAERRMSEGQYGVCVDCGTEIARERLLALPTAVRCTACENKHAALSMRDYG
jgi:DnaK suppressor protein